MFHLFEEVCIVEDVLAKSIGINETHIFYTFELIRRHLLELCFHLLQLLLRNTMNIPIVIPHDDDANDALGTTSDIEVLRTLPLRQVRIREDNVDSIGEITFGHLLTESVILTQLRRIELAGIKIEEGLDSCGTFRPLTENELNLLFEATGLKQ